LLNSAISWWMSMSSGISSTIENLGTISHRSILWLRWRWATVKAPVAPWQTPWDTTSLICVRRHQSRSGMSIPTGNTIVTAAIAALWSTEWCSSLDCARAVEEHAQAVILSRSQAASTNYPTRSLLAHRNSATSACVAANFSLAPREKKRKDLEPPLSKSGKSRRRWNPTYRWVLPGLPQLRPLPPGLLIRGVNRHPRDRDILSQSPLLLSDIAKGFTCHVSLLHHDENAFPVAAPS
jgi:hypothetical protein